MLKIPHSSAALPWPRPFLTAMLATEGMPTGVGGEVRLPGYNRATAPTSSWDAAGHPASLVAGGCSCHQAVLTRPSSLVVGTTATDTTG